MNPWIMRALDLAVALIAGAGLVLILAAALARRPSFVDRVAQGRVQERPPSALAAWAPPLSILSDPPANPSPAGSPWPV